MKPIKLVVMPLVALMLMGCGPKVKTITGADLPKLREDQSVYFSVDTNSELIEGNKTTTSTSFVHYYLNQVVHQKASTKVVDNGVETNENTEGWLYHVGNVTTAISYENGKIIPEGTTKMDDPSKGIYIVAFNVVKNMTDAYLQVPSDTYNKQFTLVGTPDGEQTMRDHGIDPASVSLVDMGEGLYRLEATTINPTDKDQRADQILDIQVVDGYITKYVENSKVYTKDVLTMSRYYELVLGHGFAPTYTDELPTFPTTPGS
ncbi:MAG: hypothetical protein LBR37_02645 [Erysipelotrichaceae bacterium]|nr:hypothetical protein [Erysipelotrichaceae bacterium]